MSQDDRKLPNDVEQLKAMIAAHGVALAARDAAIVEQTVAIVEYRVTYTGDATNRYAVYEFSLTREGKEPTRFLEGFHGYLQADAFSGYDQIYKSGQVIEVACMAHCRRYWWEQVPRFRAMRRKHVARGS